jgi:hypothetical protein
MSSEKLYYKKYLKYKQKYKILQIQIGGNVSQMSTLPFTKKKSLNFTDQGDEQICFAHSVARLFARLIKLFLLNNFDYKEDCSSFYDTIQCKNKLTIFDCFSKKEEELKIKKEEELKTKFLDNCDNYQEHISALLFHFIYVILIDKYGCMGAASLEAILYFVDYMKRTKITSNLIINKLNYDSKNHSHSNYFYLIEKLNDIINKAKSDLFNNELIVYSTLILKKNFFQVYNYDSDIASWENHALKNLLGNNELKDTLIHILDNGYYATFSCNNHIVIITEYDAINDALVIKNSYGKPTLSDIDDINKKCKMIKKNTISFTDLLNEELNKDNKWDIFFVYSTIKPTPIMQFPEFESRLETIKRKINEINEYISTKTLRQKINVNDIEEDLIYINNILNAIHSIKVTRSEITDVKKNLEKLKKNSKQFNRTIDFYSIASSALDSKLLSYFKH